MPNLIMCSDCGKMISPRAEACPHCGAPTALHRDRVQTIERTSKRWKWHQLWGAVMAINGFVFLIGATAVGDTDTAVSLAGWSTLALVLGLAWFLVARIQAWWHHG